MSLLVFDIDCAIAAQPIVALRAAPEQSADASGNKVSPEPGQRGAKTRSRSRIRRPPPARKREDQSFNVVRILQRGWAEVASRQYVFYGLVGLWLFSVGATVGSFLNVVVYRLPAGKSLVRPGSRCPKCGNAIRAIHNIPILGWFLLRGRCFDCGLPIAARYPLVEALVAFVFLLLAACELLTQGANLPARDAASLPYWGSTWIHDLQFAAIYLLHCGLAATLISAALIHFDGHRLPGTLIIPLLIVAVAGPIVWPSLRPVPIATAALSAKPEWSLSLAEALAGMLAGAVVGFGGSPPGARRERMLPLVLIGAVLGWQAAAGIAAIASIVQFLVSGIETLPARFRGPHSMWLAVVSIAWVILWKQIVTAFPALGANSTSAVFLAALAFAAIAGFLEGRLERRRAAVG